MISNIFEKIGIFGMDEIEDIIGFPNPYELKMGRNMNHQRTHNCEIACIVYRQNYLQ